jgi:hypothetical protein
MEKEIKAKVVTSYKKSGKITNEKDETETLEVMRLHDDVAYVTVSTDRKATINLGNYQSASVGVFCSAPALLNEEDMERAYRFISEFCERKVKESVDNITGEGN